MRADWIPKLGILCVQHGYRSSSPESVSISLFWQRILLCSPLFPCWVPFPLLSLYKTAFSNSLLVAQRFSHYLAICKFLVAIKPACTIYLSMLLKLVGNFLSVRCYTWDMKARPFCKANFFPAHCCQCAILVCPGSFLSKVTLATLAGGRCPFDVEGEDKGSKE